MRILLKGCFIICLISSVSNADILNNISEKISEYTAGKIPGEGYTEVSIDLRENYSPDFSILGVREIKPIQIEDGKVFTQFSLFNTESANGKKGGDERIIGNLGFGARKLSSNKEFMFGINNFYDYDYESSNFRTSLGIEARSAVLDLRINRYAKIRDNYNQENVLNGWDYELASQIPYLHWAKAFITGYEWEGVTRLDVRGVKYGSELQLTPNLNLEIAYDDKTRVGVSDDWYSKIHFIYPGVEGPTALDGPGKTAWKENRDMSGELLSKVKRSNKIMIEFKGTSTISRTD
tara:strand:- start:2022 stop:2897 length:876 start_codon:yes stop_codon:yes gene_type:complete